MKTDAVGARQDGAAMVISRAYAISEDVGREVEELLGREVGRMGDEEVRALFRKVVQTMKRGASRRGDRILAAQLAGEMETIVSKMMAARQAAKRSDATPEATVGGATQGGEGNDARPNTGPGLKPVLPVQVFHGRRVPLYEKHVNTRTIALWTENERLDVHLEQFRALHDREPTNDELIAIMHGVLKLPGVDAGDDEMSDDPFKIRDLAANIAKNGVRQPPILDNDGETPLDGNRRIAACYYILNSDEYSDEEKKQAETIRVWQLTEHAAEDDRQAVIVSLNFEDHCQITWPDYVRARKLRIEYESMIMRIGQRNLDSKRELKVRQDLAKKYALKLNRLNLLLNMMKWVEKFEAYHIDKMGRDPHEVKHFAKNKFSYFKELYDIREVLDQDDEYRELALDLLFQGKVKNWETVRHFRHHTDELEGDLRRARAEPDVKKGKEMVTSAAYAAYQRFRDSRASVGLNQRIESFVESLGKVPPKAYLDENAVTTENLQALVTLCAMVQKNAEEALKARGQGVTP